MAMVNFSNYFSFDSDSWTSCLDISQKAKTKWFFSRPCRFLWRSCLPKMRQIIWGMVLIQYFFYCFELCVRSRQFEDKSFFLRFHWIWSPTSSNSNWWKLSCESPHEENTDVTVTDMKCKMYHVLPHIWKCKMFLSKDFEIHLICQEAHSYLMGPALE